MSEFMEMVEKMKQLQSRRDYFASIAMLGHFVWNQESNDLSAKNIASGSVVMADALIAELDKPHEPVDKKSSCL